MKTSIAILAIDDDSGDLMLIQRSFETWNNREIEPHFNLSIAGTIGQGLEWLKEHRADLILLDLSLPCMQGEVCFDAVFPVCNGAPIAVFTANSDIETGKRLIRKGAISYIVKDYIDFSYLPYELTLLIERFKWFNCVKCVFTDGAE